MQHGTNRTPGRFLEIAAGRASPTAAREIGTAFAALLKTEPAPAVIPLSPPAQTFSRSPSTGCAALTLQAFRHPELVSGSNAPPATSLLVALWMLKQVQHDGGG